jgi:3-oxoacyl-[acyl-carrier protein] reductase
VRGQLGLSAYAASKGGVNALVRHLSVELAPEIRVNTVMPGRVSTDAARHWAEEMASEGRPAPTIHVGARNRWRMGDPIELAHAHLWLASDDASYVTGQEICVDGGHSVAADGALERKDN